MEEANFNKARFLAANMADLLFAQDETLEQKVVATGILFGGVAAMSGMPIEMAIVFIKNIYANADDFVLVEGFMQ